MKKYTLLLTLAIMASALQAQITQGIPAIITKSKTEKPVELKQLNIKVVVVENIAQTTFEMAFYNPNDRVMEGELNFPLAQGVTISHFALEVNGEMREGVVVDKATATQAFEVVTRRQVDPGIAEVTRGNNFKSRIYPIEPLQYKRVTIGFESELKNTEKELLYELPLGFKQVLELFSVNVEIINQSPIIPKSKQAQINLKFTKTENITRSSFSESDILLDSSLRFALPKKATSQEAITFKGQKTSDNYFYIHLDHLKNEQRPKQKPERLTVIWDVSSSAANRNIHKELSILDNYLKWIHQGSVELILFSNTIHEQHDFTIINGEVTELLSFIENIPYDGATNYDCLNSRDFSGQEILLFSDGLANFGLHQNPLNQRPIIPINTSSSADHNLLSQIADLSGGSYINALMVEPEDVLSMLCTQQKRLIRTDFNNPEIKEVYPTSGPLSGTAFGCSGISEGSNNQITFHFGYGNTITESKTVLIDNSNRLDYDLGEKIWAQKKLSHLLSENEKQAVNQHGKAFGLVTPGTSFIVLENVEDYLQYDIIPPHSLRTTYFQLLSERQKERHNLKEIKLQKLCADFNNLITWWENPPITKKSATTQAPAPQTADILNIVEDDVEIYEELEISDAVQGIAIESENDEDGIFYMREEGLAINTETASRKASIFIQKQESNADYLSDLKATNKEDLYKKYLEIKPDHEYNASYYFDVSAYLIEKGLRDEGLRVLSNLAELELENVELMRTLGRTLSEYQFHTEALFVFQEVLRIRPFEPHSHIDLGREYEALGEYQEALEHWYKVLINDWDQDISSRFRGIELIVLNDLNNLIQKRRNELDISGIESCLIQILPVDVRIVIDWDANETDMDLWITEPGGEKCFYSHSQTSLGGRLSNDITQGYGPEEYLLKHAPKGQYLIEVNFYGSRKQTAAGKVTVRAYIYTDFGKDSESRETLTLQIDPQSKKVYTIGSVSY